MSAMAPYAAPEPRRRRGGAQAAAGGALGVGGLVGVKGATEYQHRVVTGVRDAAEGAKTAERRWTAQAAAAREAKGKVGPWLTRPPKPGQTKGDRILIGNRPARLTPDMQREQVKNLRHGMVQARVRLTQAADQAPGKIRSAQKVKLGSLAALAGGTYLGIKGLRRMERDRA